MQEKEELNRKCFACGMAKYEEVFLPYDDGKIKLLSVRLFNCPNCGDGLIPIETLRQVDTARAEDFMLSRMKRG